MTDHIEDGGPAFPVHDPGWLEPRTTTESKRAAAGMTLRNYFAAKCDVSIYAPVDSFKRKYGRMPIMEELAEYISEIRYIEADAMIRIGKS